MYIVDTNRYLFPFGSNLLQKALIMDLLEPLDNCKQQIPQEYVFKDKDPNYVPGSLIKMMKLHMEEHRRQIIKIKEEVSDDLIKSVLEAMNKSMEITQAML